MQKQKQISASRIFLLGICCLLVVQPTTLLAGGCYRGSCYRSYSYPVVQKVVEQQVVQVPQVYYQVASELRDKAIAQLAVNAVVPVLQQSIAQAVRQELQGAIQGRICLELGASAGTGVGIGGGIGNTPPPGNYPPPVAPGQPTPNPPQVPQDLISASQTIFNQYCVDCHKPGKTDGDFDATNINALSPLVILRAVHLADIGAMPKGRNPIPDDAMNTLKQLAYQLSAPQAQAPQGYQQQSQQPSQQQYQAPQSQAPVPSQEQPQQSPTPTQPPVEQPDAPPAPVPPAEQPEQPQAQPTSTHTNYRPSQVPTPFKFISRPRLRYD